MSSPRASATVLGADSQVFAAWKFALDRDSPCDGWFVQQVKVDCNLKDCAGKPAPKRQQFTYYEAWPVARGERTSSENWAFVGPFPANTDGAQWQAVDCRLKGSYYQQLGEVRFYCGSDQSGSLTVTETISGENGVGWTRGHTYGSGPCATSDGGLHSIKAKQPPAFWKKLKPTKGPVPRSFRVDETCCPSGVGPVTVTPKPNNDQ
jgi:hypothetical protein